MFNFPKQQVSVHDPV